MIETDWNATEPLSVPVNIGEINMKNLFFLLCTLIFLTASVLAQADIREVDFKNFTYQPDYCGGEDRKTITVKDGEFFEEKMVEGFPDRMFFSVFGLTYGDLDGDKKDEAVILSVCNTGGTGNFTEAYIYKMQNGTPKRVMLLSGGDRAHGGLRKARVENGLLIVESNDAGELGGACCPEFIVTNTYKFDGKKLKEIGKATKRELYPATRISFDKGKSSQTFPVSIKSDDEIKRFTVGAVKGQTLLVTKTDADAKVSLWKGEADVLEEDDMLIAKLEESGDFIFELRNYGENDLEFEATVTIKNMTDAEIEDLKGKIESVYTDLNDKKCKTLEVDEEGGGSYRGECEGVGDYKLEVLEGDLRQSINVVHTKSGEKWELSFWSNVSPAFSYLGEKAEWRIRKVSGKVRPVALIVRFNASEDPEDSEKVTSYLVVTKFDAEFVCITDILKPMANQNEKARELADVAPSKPCYVRE